MLEVWGGHQVPDALPGDCGAGAGVTPDKVRMHVMKTGGGFGRRGVLTAILSSRRSRRQARSAGAPVKVQWTREDDMKGGKYRPAFVHAVKAGLDRDGRLVAWEQHIVGQSLLKGSAVRGVS